MSSLILASRQMPIVPSIDRSGQSCFRSLHRRGATPTRTIWYLSNRTHGVMKNLFRVANGVVFALLVLASAKVCVDLYGALVLEAQGFLSPDVLIYLTIGKGMLNGLHVYRDLFESKPPGIFLLSAISLRLGGTALMRTLEV